MVLCFIWLSRCLVGSRSISEGTRIILIATQLFTCYIINDVFIFKVCYFTELSILLPSCRHFSRLLIKRQF